MPPEPPASAQAIKFSSDVRTGRAERWQDASWDRSQTEYIFDGGTEEVSLGGARELVLSVHARVHRLLLLRRLLLRVRETELEVSERLLLREELLSALADFPLGLELRLAELVLCMTVSSVVARSETDLRVGAAPP